MHNAKALELKGLGSNSWQSLTSSVSLGSLINLCEPWVSHIKLGI